jgi:hypothetical protein
MVPENNSDVNQDKTPTTESPVKSITDISTPKDTSSVSSAPTSIDKDVLSEPASEPTPAAPSLSATPATPSTPVTPVSSGPTVANNDNVAAEVAHMDASESTNSNISSSPSNNKKGSKKPLMMAITALVMIILLVVVGVLAYSKGKDKEKIVYSNPPTKPISLPPQAIVSTACVPGRGKQYIVPANLPAGPFYDVVNNKVIAIEYVISINQLLSNSSTFSSLILKLTKTYPVDHFSVIPEATSATAAPQTIHLIMFVVSAKESAAITCPGESSTTSMGSMTSGTSSSSSTSTTTPTTTTTTAKP